MGLLLERRNLLHRQCLRLVVVDQLLVVGCRRHILGHAADLLGGRQLQFLAALEQLVRMAPHQADHEALLDRAHLAQVERPSSITSSGRYTRTLARCLLAVQRLHNLLRAVDHARDRPFAAANSGGHLFPSVDPNRGGLLTSPNHPAQKKKKQH